MGVGNARLDDDHKLLIELLNQLSQPIPEAEAPLLVQSILNALVDYASFHFAREEAALAAVDYPYLAAHKAAHRLVAEQAQAHLATFQADPDSLSLDQLAAFVRGWLVEHIQGEDRAFSAYLSGHPEADAAIDAVPLLGGLGPEDDDPLDDPLEKVASG